MICIASYNVNGIRSAINKNIIEWIKNDSPDIICFQEIKATPEQIDTSIFSNLNYHHFWFPATKKKGYSGVAILSKQKPLNVHYGGNHPEYDTEGRIIRADFQNFSVMSVYVPSGTMGDERQAFKYQWLDYFYDYIKNLKKQIPNLIITGDFNICHKEIDIHNPISNAKSSGFLPEERQWLSKFIDDNNYTDSFRFLNPEPHNYTWWSYMHNAREKNLGWRIDYCFIPNHINNSIKKAIILKDQYHSDHCPIATVLDETLLQ